MYGVAYAVLVRRDGVRDVVPDGYLAVCTCRQGHRAGETFACWFGAEAGA